MNAPARFSWFWAIIALASGDAGYENGKWINGLREGTESKTNAGRVITTPRETDDDNEGIVSNGTEISGGRETVANSDGNASSEIGGRENVRRETDDDNEGIVSNVTLGKETTGGKEAEADSGGIVSNVMGANVKAGGVTDADKMGRASSNMAIAGRAERMNAFSVSHAEIVNLHEDGLT
ncbi:MAG: hypothetical protein PF495_14690, partial [Spirochaetales bacterium]|nr:hypothetical protein [Spirochaetales bacterium]